MTTGNLMATLNPNIILSMVEGETTVPATMLVENPEFVELVKSADEIEELTDWVNENF